MRVFVTGASGFVGSAIVSELRGTGHQVLALARSDQAAATVTAAGAEVHRGDVEDLDSLRRGAAACDAVIHTAFIHDFARFQEVCESDRRAIEALGGALEGTRRPLVITSAVGILTPGRVGVEVDRPRPDPLPRVASERAADAVAARGVRVAVVRLPLVHGAGDHGFIRTVIDLAAKKRSSPYVGDGSNGWSAVHRLDAARLYRLAVEHEVAPGTRFHAVADEGVPFRQLADLIGRRVGVPVPSITPMAAPAHFEWLTPFVQLDMRVSSARTQQQLGWRPTQPGLLADLDGPSYFAT